MAEVFGDRLVEAIERKGTPICVGIDPIFEMLPDELAGGDPADRDANDSEAVDRRDLRVHHARAEGRRAARAGREVPVRLLREIPLGGRRGVLQPDPGGGGTGPAGDRRRQARRHRLHRHRLRRRPTSPTRPFGELDDVVTPDAITVNPMLGLDTLEPFVETAKDSARGCSCWSARATPARPSCRT